MRVFTCLKCYFLYLIVFSLLSTTNGTSDYPLSKFGNRALLWLPTFTVDSQLSTYETTPDEKNTTVSLSRLICTKTCQLGVVSKLRVVDKLFVTSIRIHRRKIKSFYRYVISCFVLKGSSFCSLET